MNWGHQLKELIIRNWREKIISLVLAFLFWFMIKAQDARQALPYTMPPPRIPQPTSIAPPQLTPVIPPPAQAPAQLEPTLPPSSAVTAPPAAKSGEAIKGAAGL